MSQQEFIPQSQSEVQQGGDEVYQPQYPYSWSAKADKKATPRDEPPSSYDEPMVPHSYQSGYLAQEAAPAAAQPAPQAQRVDSSSRRQTQTQSSQPRQSFDHDGDAFEQGYRPYNTRSTNWQAPPWARPQPQRNFPPWLIIILIVVGIMAIGPLIEFIVGLFFGLLALAFVALTVLVILRILGIRIGPRRGWRRYNPWRGGNGRWW